MEPAAGTTGDGELVVRARRGDVAAFGELVRRHEATVVRMASMVCGPSDAEDVAQEAFVRAYKALDRFEVDRPFRPWITRIVVNVAKNSVRSERRRLVLSLRAIGDASVPDVAADRAIADEQRRLLADALARLSERDRLVLACRWFEDMSERDIAVALGVRAGTVKSRLSRAMNRLRTELEELEVTRG
ncbi:MAG: sigma-70 family RNA polymerase sigma factor [Acidimicrobiia bacterium]